MTHPDPFTFNEAMDKIVDEISKADEGADSITIKRNDAPAVTQPATDWLAMIERLATMPNVNVEMIERLFVMKVKEDERQAKNAFNAAMSACQAEIGPIVRNKRNTQTNSNYADLDAIAAVTNPVITRHGFALSFGTDASQLANHYGVVLRLCHRDGHVEMFRGDIPIDAAGLKGTTNKTATHAFGSTMSYGRRYLQMMAFNMVTADNDGNRPREKPPEVISEEQFVELSILIRETNSDIAKFLELAGVESLGDLRATDFAGAKAMLLKKKAKQSEQVPT